MREQTAGTMTRAEAKAFQKDIRRGLAKTADTKFRERLDAINADAKRQRSECSQELHQILERLDQAVTDERAALGEARADVERAAKARSAAAHRLRVAEETRQAKRAQKQRACKIEADAIKERRTAEVEHRRELKAIERMTRRRDKPLASKRERKGEAADEVAQNIAPELVPLWNKVRRSFKVPTRAEGRSTLTEAFEQWAAENPDQVVAAQEEEIARELAERKARPKGGVRKARRRAVADELAAAGVPF